MCAIGVDRCLCSHCFWPLFPFILALWHFPCGISFTSALWPCVMGYWLSLPSDISSFIFVLWCSVECKNLQQQQELTARHSKVLDQRASFPLSILTRSIATRSTLVKSACHEIKSHELYLPRNELIFHCWKTIILNHVLFDLVEIYKNWNRINQHIPAHAVIQVENYVVFNIKKSELTSRQIDLVRVDLVRVDLMRVNLMRVDLVPVDLVRIDLVIPIDLVRIDLVTPSQSKVVLKCMANV